MLVRAGRPAGLRSWADLLSVVRPAGRDPLDVAEVVFTIARCNGFHPMKTIVIGLGNPILGDDGVGWRIMDEVKRKMIACAEPFLQAGEVAVDCLALGGISLMEHLIGYQRVILIDAFLSETEPGTIRVARLEEIPEYSAVHITSAHDTSLQNALKLGRELGADLPTDITVVAISIAPVRDFGEELSSPVADAVPTVTQIVMNLLVQNIITL